MPMSMAMCRRGRSSPKPVRGKAMAGSRSRNINVSEASRPVLPRHARLKFDETRQVWVILAPERVLAPDEIALEVLKLCDAVPSVGQMVDDLPAKYSTAPPATPAAATAIL